MLFMAYHSGSSGVGGLGGPDDLSASSHRLPPCQFTSRSPPKQFGGLALVRNQSKEFAVKRGSSFCQVIQRKHSGAGPLTPPDEPWVMRRVPSHLVHLERIAKGRSPKKGCCHGDRHNTIPARWIVRALENC